MSVLIDKKLIDKKNDLLIALIEHLKISLLSLLISIIIAVPLGIIINKHKKLSEWILQITGIFQTIPSLALLGLFIPFLGIGVVPVITALIIYALFPIVQSTVTGLNKIDPSLEEAAEAFGMTRFEKLKKFELALAMPVIISGIRTAAVMIIGTATLGALIGAGGLGSFILLGIDRNNSALILIGAVSSAVLAIIFNLSIKILEKANIKTMFITLVALIVILISSLIPNMMNTNKKLIIAGKIGPEPEIIINMYKELIEKNSDIKVELKPNFGKTSFLYQALKNKEVDIYPEFTGTVATSLLKDKENLDGKSDKEVYKISRDKLLTQDNLAYLSPMKYQNTYAIAVKKEFADKNNLETIDDLLKVQSNSTAGFTLEFNDRQDGNLGLKTKYNLNLTVKTMEPSLRYQAINSNDIQITDAYSTDSELKQYNLIVLKDTKHLFPPYQGAPLLRVETLDKYPELKNILNKLAEKITEEEMSSMNYEVKVKGRAASDVAHEYLVKHNLL
ncbi:ABC transporter permease/substrate-binding protein [Gemella cuniculi]|uniref:ABC transporter permease/substrate-binding protein n=1 Tax=Gemella cuniculi TaxID=150240 RepID=UPI002480FEFF|nr:ABC transporter permease/substrate-binding protein [Gemella cuniculi]